MKLFLAVAVLLLALATQSEAQDPAEPVETLGDRFNQFGDTMTELGQSIAEKTKDAVQGIQDSEFAVASRTWFSEKVAAMKAKFAEMRQ